MPLFNIGTLLESLISKAKAYGSGFIILLGIIMIAVAAFKIGKGLMTQGKPNAQPINWFLCLGLLVVGGTMTFGGFNALGGIATSLGETVDDLSNDNLFTTDGSKTDGDDGKGGWTDPTSKPPSGGNNGSNNGD